MTALGGYGVKYMTTQMSYKALYKARLQAKKLEKTRLTQYHTTANKYCKSKTFKRQRITKNAMVKHFKEFVEEVIQDQDAGDPWSIYVNGTAKKWSKLDRKLYWMHPSIKMADDLSIRDIEKKRGMTVLNKINKLCPDIERYIIGQFL